MTQTLASPPAQHSHIDLPTDRMEVGPAREQKVPRWLLIAVPVVLAVAAVSWTTASWRREAASLAGVDKFTVVPRTFSVVLEEKGELKAAKSTEIVCQVEGRSTIISLIPEGTAVKKGDLLVELASDQIEDRIQQEELREANAITAYESAQTELEIQRDKNASDIRKAKLDIELRRLALEKYEKGDWVERVKDAEIAIEQAKINLDRRKEDFEASKKLRDRGFITKTEFDEDAFAYQRAQWDLEKAVRGKEVLEQYTHIADLRQRQSDLEEAEKEYDRVVKNAEAEELKKAGALEGKKKELDLTQNQLAKLRRQKRNCRITAPTQGFVVYYSGGGGHFMSNDSQIREGATAHERQILLTLPDTTEMLVLVRVHEAKTDKLHLGQPVNVQVEGLPGRVLTGKVTKIAVVADTQNRWLNPDLKEYETEITLDPTDIPLKPGVTAHAEILVDRIENKLAVPVQAIYTKGSRRFVFCAENGEPKPTPVRLGAVSTEWAEIAEGLVPNQRVLLAFSDEEKRLIPDEPAHKRGSRGRASAPGRAGSPGAAGHRRPDRGTAPSHRAGQQGKRPARSGATMPKRNES